MSPACGSHTAGAVAGPASTAVEMGYGQGSFAILLLPLLATPHCPQLPPCPHCPSTLSHSSFLLSLPHYSIQHSMTCPRPIAATLSPPPSPEHMFTLRLRMCKQ